MVVVRCISWKGWLAGLLVVGSSKTSQLYCQFDVINLILSEFQFQFELNLAQFSPSLFLINLKITYNNNNCRFINCDTSYNNNNKPRLSFITQFCIYYVIVYVPAILILMRRESCTDMSL